MKNPTAIAVWYCLHFNLEGENFLPSKLFLKVKIELQFAYYFPLFFKKHNALFLPGYRY
jgi:hypothetical protein